MFKYTEEYIFSLLKAEVREKPELRVNKITQSSNIIISNDNKRK